MPTCSASVDLESPQRADEAGIDLLFTAVRQKHFRREFASRQAALERSTHSVRMTAKGFTPFFLPAKYGIQVLVPEQGEFAELLQAALDQPSDEREVNHRIGIADLAVFVEVQDAD